MLFLVYTLAKENYLPAAFKSLSSWWNSSTLWPLNINIILNNRTTVSAGYISAWQPKPRLWPSMHGLPRVRFRSLRLGPVWATNYIVGPAGQMGPHAVYVRICLAAWAIPFRPTIILTSILHQHAYKTSLKEVMFNVYYILTGPRPFLWRSPFGRRASIKIRHFLGLLKYYISYARDETAWKFARAEQRSGLR
jgi:hypothetical protein